MKTIDTIIDYVISQRKVDLSLETFKQLMPAVYPFEIIHVTGTNGKGSCVNFIRNGLNLAGQKVGTFTSPHIEKHQDRICIDGQMIDDDAFQHYFEKGYDLFQQYHFSMFHMDLWIAMQYFIDQKVDVVIVEVGIGGRLDYTNIFEKTKMCIITNVGYDHMDRLGSDLVSILKEKAGIIKENSLVVTGIDQPLLLDVLKDYTKNLYVAKVDKQYANGFIYENEFYTVVNHVVYQMKNAAISIQALKLMNIQSNFIHEAIATSQWPGRFEKIGDRLILDGAHNLEGVQALITSLQDKCLIVFSAMQDKPYEKMISAFIEAGHDVLVTTFDYPRVFDLNGIQANVIKEENYLSAIEWGLSKNEYKNVVVCGSLYFISDVKKNIKRLIKR